MKIFNRWRYENTFLNLFSKKFNIFLPFIYFHKTYDCVCDLGLNQILQYQLSPAIRDVNIDDVDVRWMKMGNE